MRIIIAILSVIVLLFGCADNREDTYFAVAADFPSYDALRAVIGSDDDILMLLPPGTESHGYDSSHRMMILRWYSG